MPGESVAVSRCTRQDMARKRFVSNDSWTFPPAWRTMTVLPPDEPDQGTRSNQKTFVIQKPAATKPIAAPPEVMETESQRFERILNRVEFKPLKAVFDQLVTDNSLKIAAIITTNTYQMFLGKLGYRVELVKQIHEQDCYSRLGPAGGIRAVVPLHDIATYSTLVTVVNYDATILTTPKAVDYYDQQLTEFKIQLMNRSGNVG
jgi:hypothetical protein